MRHPTSDEAAAGEGQSDQTKCWAEAHLNKSANDMPCVSASSGWTTSGSLDMEASRKAWSELRSGCGCMAVALQLLALLYCGSVWSRETVLWREQKW